MLRVPPLQEETERIKRLAGRCRYDGVSWNVQSRAVPLGKKQMSKKLKKSERSVSRVSR